jgi:hypothetical protein
MSPRTTLAALGVLAALGGYIYKYERDPIETESDSKREKIFAFEDSKVRSIEIVPAEGEAVRVVRDETGWRLTAPTEAACDQTEASSLARSLAGLERERVVAEAGAALADFGLAEPRLQVRFEVEGEAESRAFLLGDPSPTGNSLYAKLSNEDRVFVIASYHDSTFNKKAWDLRDKAVMKFDRDDVERVVVKRPQSELVLAKASEDLWNVTTPSMCRADRYKASGLVSRFETARMEEIVSESPADLETYGLEAPAFEVEFHLRGGRLRKLLVGKEKDGRYYARNPARPMIYLIGSSLVDDLKKDQAEYRSRRLFDFSTYQVSKFQIASGEVTRVVEKTKKDDSDQWREVAPEEKDLDRSKVEDLLYKLNGTDAEDFAADRASDLAAYGLDRPFHTFTVWSNEDKTIEELAVGKRDGDSVFARRKGDEPVLRLKASSWEEIEKLLSFEVEKKQEEAKDQESAK